MSCATTRSESSTGAATAAAATPPVSGTPRLATTAAPLFAAPSFLMSFPSLWYERHGSAFIPWCDWAPARQADGTGMRLLRLSDTLTAPATTAGGERNPSSCAAIDEEHNEVESYCRSIRDRLAGRKHELASVYMAESELRTDLFLRQTFGMVAPATPSSSSSSSAPSAAEHGAADEHYYPDALGLDFYNVAPVNLSQVKSNLAVLTHVSQELIHPRSSVSLQLARPFAWRMWASSSGLADLRDRLLLVTCRCEQQEATTPTRVVRGTGREGSTASTSQQQRDLFKRELALDIRHLLRMTALERQWLGMPPPPLLASAPTSEHRRKLHLSVQETAAVVVRSPADAAVGAGWRAACLPLTLMNGAAPSSTVGLPQQQGFPMLTEAQTEQLADVLCCTAKDEASWLPTSTSEDSTRLATAAESTTTASGRGNGGRDESPQRLSDVVPMCGLIAGYIHRLMQEHKTALEIWDRPRR